MASEPAADADPGAKYKERSAEEDKTGRTG